MHTLKRQRRRVRDEHDEIEMEHPRFSYATYGLIVAGGTALIGTAANMYGANKQSKADAEARRLTYAAEQEAERQNWARWLASRGIAPGPEIQTGVIPGTVAGQVINTKLPLWMNVSVPQQMNPRTPTAAAVGAGQAAADVPFLVKKGGA